MRAEELKGHLDALLLAALEDGPRHGYAVIEALRQATGGQLDMATGTVYPALRRLEVAGLITGSWSVVAGRRRREIDSEEQRRAARAGRHSRRETLRGRVVAKLRWGTPFLLTEHGVYVREQYLNLGRSIRSIFGPQSVSAEGT